MRRALVALGLAALGGLLAGTVAAPAHADTVICEQFGSTTIQGRYVVQNNRWGTTAQQCINVTETGFSITAQQGETVALDFPQPPSDVATFPKSSPS